MFIGGNIRFMQEMIFFFTTSHGILDLIFLTRDQTHAPCIGNTES